MVPESPAQIVVIGATAFDIAYALEKPPPRDGTAFASATSAGPGGKGLNQAVATRRLGGDAALLTASGDDARSREMAAFLTAEGFNDARVAMSVRHDTALPVVAVIVSAEGIQVFSPELAMYPRVSLGEIAERTELLRSASCVLITLDYGLEILEAVLNIVETTPVVLNPAPLVEDAADLTGVLAEIDWLVPNVSEARHLLGSSARDLHTESTLVHRLLDLGVRNVCLTAGRRGSYYGGATAKRAIASYPAYDVRTVDATGASDAFCGAVAVGVARGKPIHEIIRTATAAAALATTRRGAAVSMPFADAVDRLLADRRSC